MQFRFYLLFAFLLFIFQVFTTTGEELNVSSLTVLDGLPQSNVRCITKDSNDYIWLGTKDGLCRYNGVEFKIYRYKNDSVPNSICNNMINCLQADKNGQLWIGTSKGFCSYSSQYNQFKTFENTYLETLSIQDILVVNESSLLLATNQGCVLFNPSDPGSLKVIFKEKNVQSILPIDSTSFLVSSGKLLYKIHVNSDGFTNFSEITRLSTRITKLEMLENNLFIGTQNSGVFHFNYQNSQITLLEHFSHQTFGSQLYPILDMSIITDKLWVGSENGGLYIIDWQKKTSQNFTHNAYNLNGLSSNSIYAIYASASNKVWLGTYSQGVNIYSPDQPVFTTISIKTSPAIENNFVTCFSESNDGHTFYIGTDGGGIFQWNRTTNTIQNLEKIINKLIPNSFVECMVLDKNNTLWVGSYMGGLFKINLNNKTIAEINLVDKKSNSGAPDKIWSLHKSRDNNLWIGTLGNGLIKLDRTTGKMDYFRHHKNDTNSINSNNIITIAEGRTGDIWIGTTQGLNQIKSGTNKVIRHNVSSTNGILPTNNISCLKVTKDGTLWIGTKNGLATYTPDKEFKYFEDSDKLPNKTIKAIIEDNSKSIWISTNKGIVKITPNENSFLSFDHTDKLPDNEYNVGAGFKSNNGDLYFGSNSGMVYFSPNQINSNTEVPEIKIEELKIFNNVISPNDEKGILTKHIQHCDTLTIPYKHKVVTFDYVGITYPSSPRNQYAYYLEHFEEDWNYVGTKRSATYTNLKPGTYTLKIKAANSQGVWSKTPKELVVIVTPPFWYTTTAFILYVMFIVLVLLAARKIILMPVKHNEEIRIERLKRAQNEQINKTRLQFFTNISHEFRTPLTLILGPLETLKSNQKWNNQLDVIYENAQHLLHMINQLLEFRKIETKELNLKYSSFNIHELIKNVAFLFQERATQNKITLELSLSEDSRYIYLSPDGIRNILMNLLSNAFKYTPQGGKITIGLRIHEATDSLTITVDDTGKGINPEHVNKLFNRFFTGDESQGTGIGLSYAHKLATHQKGELSYHAKDSKGSTFKLVVPMNSDKFNSGLIPTQLSEEKQLADNKTELLEDKLSENYKVLIVDDNPGILNLLEDSLNNSFDLIRAFDGNSALTIVKDQKPDLVISDVMMPGLNGFELCKAIKSDINISHIPILLLTALDSEEAEYIGLEYGADDYIAKPFNPLTLRQRVIRRIQTKEQIQLKYIAQPESKVDDLATTNIDNKFINDIVSYINDNISDSELNVEKLADSLHVSRSFLYKKIKSLTGNSATEFIRLVRLKRAAQLLKKEQKGIAQIAYEVGFSSPSYFSQSFKKFFEITPNEYIEKYR